MHFVMTSRRCIPDSRASSVGVKWIAIGESPSVADLWQEAFLLFPADVSSRNAEFAHLFDDLARRKGLSDRFLTLLRPDCSVRQTPLPRRSASPRARRGVGFRTSRWPSDRPRGSARRALGRPPSPAP